MRPVRLFGEEVVVWQSSSSNSPAGPTVQQLLRCQTLHMSYIINMYIFFIHKNYSCSLLWWTTHYYTQVGLADQEVYDQRIMDEVKVVKLNKDVLYLITDKEVRMQESWKQCNIWKSRIRTNGDNRRNGKLCNIKKNIFSKYSPWTQCLLFSMRQDAWGNYVSGRSLRNFSFGKHVQWLFQVIRVLVL